MKKKYYAAVVGYGNRGQVYADFSLDEPERFGVAAVIDPNPFKRQEAQKRYGLTADRLFSSFSEFVSSGISCDFVINATMDGLHYETAMEILSAGCHMLMEKPIVPQEEQLLGLRDLAREKGCMVFVCHVLRYTPFYKTVKELVNAGRIGKIMALELSEHVGISHYLASYTRGKWNSEKACGSSFLLAKSCHDMDLLCWLNNESAPAHVSSFGSRRQFLPENAPADSAEYCHLCPHEHTCPYSATIEYAEHNIMPFLVWDRLNKPLDEITDTEKREFLKTDTYGRCAYKIGGDLVDRQNVIVEFQNGSVGTFNLIGGCTAPGRSLHILGTKGEIEGKLEENRFVIKEYDPQIGMGRMEEIELKPVDNAKYGGHSGGDYAIMQDLLNFLDGSRSSVSITSIEDSVNGHLCVFAADRSRREHQIVDL